MIWLTLKKKMLLQCVSRQESRSDPLRKKLVVVGDGECGKTCLLQRFVTGNFQDYGYLPTVFEVDIGPPVQVNDKMVEFSLYDTAGQECYDRLRPISYVDTDVVLVVFSIDNPDSLTNVLDNWSPEVRHFCVDVPVLLVGTKSDLRNSIDDDRGSDSSLNNCRLIKEGPIKYEQAQKVAKIIGAVKYVECSSKLNIGIQAVFNEAAKACFLSKKKRKQLFSSNKINRDNILHNG